MSITAVFQISTSTVARVYYFFVFSEVVSCLSVLKDLPTDFYAYAMQVIHNVYWFISCSKRAQSNSLSPSSSLMLFISLKASSTEFMIVDWKDTQSLSQERMMW